MLILVVEDKAISGQAILVHFCVCVGSKTPFCSPLLRGCSVVIRRSWEYCLWFLRLCFLFVLRFEMTMVVRISLCLGFGVLSMSQMASQLLWLFPFCVCILGHVGIRAKRRSVMFFAAITGPCSAIFFLSWRASVEFRRRLKITCRRLLQPRCFFFFIIIIPGSCFFSCNSKSTFVIYQRRYHCSPLFLF